MKIPEKLVIELQEGVVNLLTYSDKVRTEIGMILGEVTFESEIQELNEDKIIIQIYVAKGLDDDKNSIALAYNITKQKIIDGDIPDAEETAKAFKLLERL